MDDAGVLHGVIVRARGVDGVLSRRAGPSSGCQWSGSGPVVRQWSRAPAVIGLWFSDVRWSPEDNVNYRRDFVRLIQSELIEIAYRPRGRGAG